MIVRAEGVGIIFAGFFLGLAGLEIIAAIAVDVPDRLMGLGKGRIKPNCQG